jgi:hypothetical protein
MYRNTRSISLDCAVPIEFLAEREKSKDTFEPDQEASRQSDTRSGRLACAIALCPAYPENKPATLRLLGFGMRVSKNTLIRDCREMLA